MRADRGEVDPVAGHDVHPGQQVGERVVAAGPRGLDRLVLGEAGRQLPSDHAVEQQVGGMAEDPGADDTDGDAEDRQRHDGDGESALRGQPFDQPQRRTLEIARALGRLPAPWRAVRRATVRSRLLPGAGAHRLGVGELGVGGAIGQQAVVGSDPDHPAVVEDDHLIGAQHGRNPLRDNDQGGIGGHLAQMLPHSGVGVHVERRQRVVEQIDGRATG